MKLKVKTSLLEFSKFNIVTILSKLVAVFFLPFLTTLLPKEEIGIISIYTRLIGLLSILFGLGYFSQIIKIKSILVSKKLITEFSIILLIGFLLSFFFFLVPSYGSYNIGLIALPAVSLAGLTFFRNYYRLNLLTNKYIFNELIFIFTSVGFSLLLLYFFTSYLSRIWGLCLSYLLTFIFYFSRFKSINIKLFKSFSFLKNSVALLPHMILKWIRSRSDIILIAMFFSKSDVGDYAIALSVSSLVLVFYDAHNQYFLSISKKYFQSNNIKIWFKEILKSLIFYVVILIGLQLFIDLIYSVFDWGDYEDGKIYARLLSVVFFLRSIPNLLTTYFNFHNLNILLSKITFITSLFYIIFGIICLKYFFVEYFIFMLIFSELFLSSIFIYFIRHEKKSN
ncbi:oligosaccharide flippase family protein [Flavobacteriaceae bacterium]|nr:oligosaccharide flippase family protein [Flavobacteriaceae bacterium]